MSPLKQPQLTWVTQVYHPDQQATSQLLSALTHALAHPPSTLALSPSWSIRVLCSYPSQARMISSHQATNQWTQDSSPSSPSSPSSAPLRLQIERGGIAIDSKRSLFHRALSYLAFLIWLMWKLLWRTSKDEQVIVVTNPPFAPLIVGFCARIRRLWGRHYQYSVLLHDLYPDGLVALNPARRDAWWVKLWRIWHRSVLNHARWVITLGRDMERYCSEVYHLPHERLTTITNWSPVEWSCDQERAINETALWQTLPERARAQNMVIIQYSGNMGLWHDMEGLVRAASLVRDLPLHFLMIGEGRRKEGALKLAETLELENITWLPFQPLESLHDSLQCAHLSLVSQRLETLGIMVPSKLYGVLASGRGVIAQVPLESEVSLTLREHRCGVVIDNMKPEALAEALRQLARDPVEIERMGKAARLAYRERYSFAQATLAFHRLFSPHLSSHSLNSTDSIDSSQRS